MTSPEFSAWLAFDALYNLPDVFFMVGTLAPMIRAAFGKSSRASEFVPYFAPVPTFPGEIQSAQAGLAAMAGLFPEALGFKRPERKPEPLPGRPLPAPHRTL